MAKKCKVFYEDAIEDIESKINKWLKDNKAIAILGLHYQHDYRCGHNVLIIYESDPYDLAMPVPPPYYSQPQYSVTPFVGGIKVLDNGTLQTQSPDPNPPVPRTPVSVPDWIQTSPFSTC